jgi:hypothetical protein
MTSTSRVGVFLYTALGSPNYSTITLQLWLSYMMSGAPGWKYGLWSSQKTARLSSRLSGVNVAGARDDLWGCHCLAFLRLAAMLSHMGADVDGLAYRLHQPTNGG